MNKTKCSQRTSPPPPPRQNNTDPFNIKNVVRVRWSDGVQCTRVSTGQLSRSHSQYYTASLWMSEATTQMSVRLAKTPTTGTQDFEGTKCAVSEGEGLAGKKSGHRVKVIVKVKE